MDTLHPNVRSGTTHGGTEIAGPSTSVGGPQQPIEHSSTLDVGLVGPLDGPGLLPSEKGARFSTPSLPLDVEETTHNDFRRLDFSNNSSMPLVVDPTHASL